MNGIIVTYESVSHFVSESCFSLYVPYFLFRSQAGASLFWNIMCNDSSTDHENSIYFEHIKEVTPTDANTVA